MAFFPFYLRNVFKRRLQDNRSAWPPRNLVSGIGTNTRFAKAQISHSQLLHMSELHHHWCQAQASFRVKTFRKEAR